jgi:hypothetical protein
MKVGLTRERKMFERWGDQGAISAIRFAKVAERKIAGELEAYLMKFVKDKTDWRALITGVQVDFDVKEFALEIKSKVEERFQTQLLKLEDEAVFKFNYPILAYPQKAKVFNAEKEKVISGKLNGIRGQYLLIDDRAINIRKYQGYEVKFATE